MEEIREEIIKILQKMKGNDFLEECNLISGGFLDSFELLMFIKELEEHFSIRIPLEKISPAEFNSVDSVYGMVKTLLKIAEK